MILGIGFFFPLISMFLEVFHCYLHMWSCSHLLQYLLTAFRIEIPAVSSASNSEDSSVFYWYSCSTLLIPSSGTFLKFICLLLILQSIRLCSPPFVFQKVVLKLRLCSVPCLQIGLAFHMCSLATFHPFCFNLPASLYLKWVSYSQHILGGVF